MTTKHILLPGDGIGPEVVVASIDAYETKLKFERPWMMASQ